MLQIDSTSTEARPFRTVVTQARINAIATAAARYCLQFGGIFPEDYDDMLRQDLDLVASPCRLTEDMLEDAWEHPIYYSREAEGIRVVSAGADGRFTTEDDIELPATGALHAKPLGMINECAAGRW